MPAEWEVVDPKTGEVVAVLEGDNPPSPDVIRRVVAAHSSKTEMPTAKEGSGPVGRFLTAAVEEPIMATGKAVVQGLGELVKPENLLPGVAPYRLAKHIGEGLYEGSAEQLRLAKEQYEKGGINERGPNGSLSPVGRVLAATPLFGPIAAGIVDRGASGDVAGAMGELTAAEITRMLPEVAVKGVRSVKATRAATAAEDAASARRAAAYNEQEANAIADMRARSATEAETAQRADWIARAEEIRKARQANIPTDRQAANTALGARDADYVGGRDPAMAALRNITDDPEALAALTPDEIAARAETAMQGHQKTVAERLAVQRDVTDVTSAGMVVEGTFRPLIAKWAGRDRTWLVNRANKELGIIRKQLARFQDTINPAQAQELITSLDDMIAETASRRARPIQNALKEIRTAFKATLYEGDPALAAAKGELRDLPMTKRAAMRKAQSEKAAGVPKQTKVPEFDPLPDKNIPGSVAGPMRPGMIGAEDAALEAVKKMPVEELLRLAGAAGNMAGVPMAGAATSGANIMALLRKLGMK